MEGSGRKEEEASASSVYEQTSDVSRYLVQRELFSSSSGQLPESKEKEPLKENWSSYSHLVDKPRTRMREHLPCLKGKYEDSSLEGTKNECETGRLWEDTIQDEVAFQKKLHEAELAIGSAEMFLPSFKETLSRISKIFSTQIEDLIQKLTDSEAEAVELTHEMLRKERYILELSTQLQHEKANVLKASHRSESTQLVETHLKCQIERKEAENNQLRTKFKAVEKNIAEWKRQVAEYKQQILAEKDRREERRNALKRAVFVQKQRAELLKEALEIMIPKIKEKEIQLSEVLSACNVWKSHHETVADEKTRLEVQVETLKKQIADRVMELRRIQDAGRRSRKKILGKLNAITSENEKISLENAQLKEFLASLEASIVCAEVELVDLREEAQQKENVIEQYTNEVCKLEMEAEELKARYEKVIHESKKVMDGKNLESYAVASNDGFLKQFSLEEENRSIQLKYEDVKRKLEEMELKNKELENQFASQEECLQKTELQLKQKLASYDALTRQLGAALEDGRKRLEEEVEKINSKEQALQTKILDLENQLRQKKEEQRHLSRRLDAREKHRQVSLKDLEHSLQRSENQNQSIQNYVKFLKTTYVTMFG